MALPGIELAASRDRHTSPRLTVQPLDHDSYAFLELQVTSQVGWRETGWELVAVGSHTLNLLSRQPPPTDIDDNNIDNNNDHYYINNNNNNNTRNR
jgi:hypothetical protein